MNRILWIELRRSAAAWIALILIAIGIVTLYSVPQNWSAGWMKLALNQREYLGFLFPLALAAGAWQARREKRSKVAELFSTTPRPVRQRVLPTLGAMGLAAGASYLVATAVAVPRIFDTSADYLPAAAFGVVGVGALSLVAAVWIGLALGRLVPTVVTAPALALGYGLLQQAFYSLGEKYDWLFALAFPDRSLDVGVGDYGTIDGRLTIGQTLLLGGLAVGAMVLLAARSRAAYATAVLVAAAGFAAGIAVMPRVADFDAMPLDPVAQEQVCADGTPRVCVARVHSGLMPEVLPLARQGLALLAKIPGAPTQAEEDTTRYSEGEPPPPPAGTVRFEVKVDRDGHLGFAHEVPELIVEDAVVTNFERCGPDRDTTAVARASSSFLTGQAPRSSKFDDPEAVAKATELWQKLKQLPEAEALARIAAVRAAAMACKPTAGVLERSAR